MLKAIETTPQKFNNNNNTITPHSTSASVSKAHATPPTATAVTTNNQSQSANAEEKQQRRRSTFYVPLVIEDDDDHNESTSRQSNDLPASSNSLLQADTSSLGGQSSVSSTSTSTAPERKSVSSCSGSASGSGSRSKAEKNSNNNNLKKSTSLKNASATSKVAALLFERTNSTLGFGASGSNSSNAGSGVVKRNSAKKMSPPCGFNWTISGNTADTDLEEDSDASEQITATVVNKNAGKDKLKLSRLTQKTEKRHSTSSKSSVNSNATTASLTSSKAMQKTSVNAKTKRYGIVLNGISLDDEQLQIAQPMHASSKSTPTKTCTNLVEFNEDDIVLATPNKQARSSRTPTTPGKPATSSVNKNSNNNSNSTRITKHGRRADNWRNIDAHDSDIDVGDDESLPHSDMDTDDNRNDGDNDDDDDDSEISRIQTNTSTPIKMMKSRSRTNILSVPSVEQHNLLSVAAAAVKPNANATPLLLRAKSKTLPQNLSPSVVLQQSEALFDECNTSGTCQTKTTKTTGGGAVVTSTSRTARLIGPLTKVHHNLFGGSVASHIGASATTTHSVGGAVKSKDANKLAHSASTSLITQTFPPKHLFLLKSTSKLPISNTSSSASTSLEHSKSKATKSFSSDTSITSPPNASAIQTQTVTSPPKKSLSFIRRAHSTKLSRNNSLLKSIASQHQQNIQQSSSSSSANMAGNWIVDCSGSWGKDFYLNYDVCPLALDELESYFRSERCTSLIRERFKILDIPLNCSAADESHHQQQQDSSLRELDTSCSSQQHLRVPGTTEDDDAGHHSGEFK